jgi:uncharacterized protein YoxC
MVEIGAVNDPFRVGLTALFVADDLPGDYDSVQWDFGRGGLAFGVRPSVTFQEAGPVTVSVEVIQSPGEVQETVATAERTFEVAEAVEEPEPTPEPPEPPPPEPEPEPSPPADVIGAEEFAEGPAAGEFADTPLQTYTFGASSFELQAIRNQDGGRLVQPGDRPTAVIDQINPALETGVKRFIRSGDRIPETAQPGTTVTREYMPPRFEIGVSVSGATDGPQVGPGAGTPDPRPGQAPLLQIPRPTLESRTLVILGEEFTVPSSLTFGEESFPVRLPAFRTYLQTANLGFDLSAVGRRLDSLTSSVDRVGLDLTELERRVRSLPGSDVIQRLREDVNGLGAELDGLASEVRSEVRRRVAETTSLVREVDDRLTRLFEQTQTRVAGLEQTFLGRLTQTAADIRRETRQAFTDLRGDILPEALDRRNLARTVRGEVRAVLPVRVDQLGEAVQTVRDLRESESFQSFRSDPAGYILDAVFSEAERRVGDGLASRLKRLGDSLLESSLEPETRERLRERSRDDGP